MDQKSKKGILVSGLLLVIASIVIQIIALIIGRDVGFSKTLYVTMLVVDFLAYLLVGLYIVTGFKKKSAILYKLYIFSFMFVMAHQALVTSLFVKDHIITMIELALEIIAFGFLNVLAFAKDLGKAKSLFFAYAILALYVIIMIMSCINLGMDDKGTGIGNFIINNIGLLSLPVVLIATSHMKYLDKTLRKGTPN